MARNNHWKEAQCLSADPNKVTESDTRTWEKTKGRN